MDAVGWIALRESSFHLVWSYWVFDIPENVWAIGVKS